MATLIKNGLVYDGSGGAPQKADIVVQEGQIAHIGTFSNAKADDVIDATGAIVTPGFVDVSTYADQQGTLFSDPYQIPFIEEGITTIVGGNCGESLAPYARHELDFSAHWKGASSNKDWDSMRRLFKALKKKKLGVNFATLVGYTSVRRMVLGDAKRDLTENEFRASLRIVEESLRAGALGVSFDLEHASMREVPRYELEELATLVERQQKLLAVHLRYDGEDFENGLDVLDAVAKKTGANMEIAHFMPRVRTAEAYRVARERFEEKAGETHMHFDCTPFPWSIVPASSFLPDWAEEGTPRDILERLTTPHLAEHIRKSLDRLDPDRVVVASIPSPLSHFSGKTLAEVAETFHIHTGEALMRLILLSETKAMCFDRSVDEPELARALASPACIITSGSPGIADEFHEETLRVPFLPSIVDRLRGGEAFPLEAIIAKLTGLPAQKYGIAKRGRIKETYFADIVVLRDLRPTAVLMNGVRVFEKGGSLHRSAGRVVSPRNSF